MHQKNQIKQFTIRPLQLMLILVLIMQQQKAYAQITKEQTAGYVDPYMHSIDTNKNVSIVYPSLTEREGKGLNMPIPPNEHPRLYFRKKDIPSLKQNISNPLLSECWNGIIKTAGLVTDGKLKQNVKHNIDFRVLNAIEAKAFLYAFEMNILSGKEAVEAIKNINATVIIDYSKQDVCRDIGRVIHAAAIVYDWCYDLIGVEEKRIMILQMESLASKLEIIWPKLVQGSIVGHGVESQLSRDMLSCGIATYNEKPEIYNLVAGRIFAEFIPARNFFYPAAYHHQGSAYGPGRFRSDLEFTLLFNKMGYPNVVSKYQGLVPYKWLYTRRPDGQILRDGDDYNELFIKFGSYWSISGDAIVASYYQDSVLMGEAIKEKQIGRDPLYDFLLIDPAVHASAKSNIPLSKYFKEPLGSMVARTGWGDNIKSNTVVAEMKIGVYNFANHQHLDAGSFQLYYKGPLAVNSGIYQGANGGYGSEHFINYYQRTIAHNSMLIYKPDEKFIWHSKAVVNDGGQQYVNGGAEPLNLDMFLTKDYKTGEVLAHDFGPDSVKPDYTYIKGELAEAYSDKVKSFKRSFVFLNLYDEKVPAALIVFDCINTLDKTYKKTWLLHTVEEPVIEGNISTVKRSEKGYNGQLVNTTLLPNAENLSLNKVGGKGNEYTVNGKNFPQTIAAADNSADGAIWRIEISPKAQTNTDNFLNVMQVMDYNSGNSKSLTVEKVETGQFIGTRIGDRLVLFNKNSKVEKNPVKLHISGEGFTSVLITDLEKGNWKIESTKDKKNALRNIKNKKNLIYFKVKKGDYIVTKQND